MNLRFAPNLSMLWAGLTLADLFERAAKAGFGAVELWWPGDSGAAAFAAPDGAAQRPPACRTARPRPGRPLLRPGPGAASSLEDDGFPVFASVSVATCCTPIALTGSSAPPP